MRRMMSEIGWEFRKPPVNVYGCRYIDGTKGVMERAAAEGLFMSRTFAWDWGKMARNSVWVLAAVLVGIGSTLFALEVRPDGTWTLDGDVVTVSAVLWASARAGLKWIRMQAGDKGITRFF